MIRSTPYGGAVLFFLMLVSALQAQPEDEVRARQVRIVLRDRCHSCHSGEGSASGYEFDVLRDETMKVKIGEDEPVVVAGKPEKSKLYTYIEKDRMPQGKDKLSAAEKELIKKWIETGAAAFPLEAARKFVTLEQMLTAVRDDLRAAERKDRPYRRYFSLTHLYNNKRVPDADLRIYRAALAKVLNSLSWKSAIVVPQAVKGSFDTVYAIDVRNLDWDRNNLWDEILKHYPFGLRYNNHPTNKELRKLDEEIYDLTKNDNSDGCDVFVVRGDWFAATASRPPLYHALLFDAYLPELRKRPVDAKAALEGNPKRMTARDLEDYLKVDIKANYLNPSPERIARAGFVRSGVSGQNRLLERCDARTGAYWKSYDFKPDSKRTKLTRFPLGPLNLFPEKNHPYPAQAFVHDGGEIIFNLPNGLQGYLLINGKDERIDEGPVQVVSDPSRTSGTPVIVTGVSCMNCHAQGMIGFKDEIRQGNALFGKARDKVDDLYPEQDKLDRLVRDDRDRFMAAAEKTIREFLLTGEDSKKTLDQFREPVGEIARRYRLEYLDLEEIALELFEEEAGNLRNLVGNKEFKQLGLGVLLKKGGTISRLEWETIDGRSLMQIVAHQLGATPVIPVK